MLNALFQNFISLIYPRTCAGCGSELPGARLILCWSCINTLPLTGFEKKRFNLVEDLFAGRLSLEMATGFLFFNKGSAVQHIIHLLKYRGRQDVGIHLGNMMGAAMLEAGWQDSVDVIVPLPLNRKKELQRGFNQAAVLATGIGEIIQRPVDIISVQRNRFTETQTRKSREKRWENVGDVFILANPGSLANKKVLLVDDVVTTGATLEACGQVLLKEPGVRLSIAAMAFASPV